MTRIKLCGIRTPVDVEGVNTVCPEYIGFVFYGKSRRYISPDKAKELKALLNEKISAVGVFVDESAENVAGLLLDGIIDIAQLHGNEDEEYVSKLKRMTDKPVIKAFRMEEGVTAEQINCFPSDYVLIDSGAGCGATFDWSKAKTVTRPFFLAGGLTPQNVEKALKDVRPFAVDVSSGIETDNHKDFEKMKAFIDAVRRFEK